ncbi:hypothetical protein ACIBQ1_50285 [Nonomuraea sp. NPDC050153]|uniref:hypothetical protein n=1 Tax=Nonomuraea sp. NPDC050153 TaxID=3364359 RepID=UPI0037B7DDA8
MVPYVQSVGFSVNRVHGGTPSYRIVDANVTGYAGWNAFNSITITNTHAEWFTWPPNFNDLNFDLTVTCTSDPNASFSGPPFMALKNLPPDGTPNTLLVTCPEDTPVLSSVRPTYDATAVTMTNAQQFAPDQTPGWATTDFTNATTSANTKSVTLVATCTQASA